VVAEAQVEMVELEMEVAAVTAVAE